jgi:hypothetical protein
MQIQEIGSPLPTAAGLQQPSMRGNTATAMSARLTALICDKSHQTLLTHRRGINIGFCLR